MAAPNMTQILTEQDITYFDALWLRRAEAKKVQRCIVAFRDESAPRRSDCHANAARWASENSEATPVHGWLIETDDGHHIRLAAHSLLKDLAGNLFDITPTHPFDPPFLIHNGGSEEFFALLPRFNSTIWPAIAGGCHVPPALD